MSVKIPHKITPTTVEHRTKELVIGLCIPLSGPAGIWGPSSLASAKLAVEELNLESGIAGLPCQLVLINAGDDSPDIENRVADLINSKVVDVLVGMHTSAVRHRILKAVRGRIPFVYTPLYEGEEVTPGVYAIGETPVQQLRPSIDWLSTHEHLKRWLLLGNDYIWPRISHRLATAYIEEANGQVIDEIYLPLGTVDFSAVFDRIRTACPDGILLSLIGQDAIEFNRVFGDMGMSEKIKRLSCSIEENVLLGIGAENTKNLFVASSYFSALKSDANMSFKERYHARFGQRAPLLNTLGQSTYEGIHFLAALYDKNRKDEDATHALESKPLFYHSARDAQYVDNAFKHAPMYLARASGHLFDVITQL